jgi:hypothetical protein
MRNWTPPLPLASTRGGPGKASWRFTKEANAQARQLFGRAIALDPQYAAAYAALSGAQLEAWYIWEAFRFSLDQILAL